MWRPRVSLLGLMLVVSVVALGLAALRSASASVFRIYYSFSLIVLLFSVLMARYQARCSGAFWFGFAVFGWGYFLIGLGPTRGGPSEGFGANGILITDEWCHDLARRLEPDKSMSGGAFSKLPPLDRLRQQVEHAERVLTTYWNLHFLVLTGFAIARGICSWLLFVRGDGRRLREGGA